MNESAELFQLFNIVTFLVIVLVVSTSIFEFLLPTYNVVIEFY